jgi:hypothetical protein
MLSSGDLDFVKTGLSGVKTVMEQYFIEKFKNKLDNAYLQDTHGGSRGEKLERESQLSFIVRGVGNKSCPPLITSPRLSSTILRHQHRIWTV